MGEMQWHDFVTIFGFVAAIITISGFWIKVKSDRRKEAESVLLWRKDIEHDIENLEREVKQLRENPPLGASIQTLCENVTKVERAVEKVTEENTKARRTIHADVNRIDKKFERLQGILIGKGRMPEAIEDED